MEIKVQRIAISLFASILFVTIAEALPPDTVKPHLPAAQEVANKWASDARFVYLQSNSDVLLDGSIQCENTAKLGWMFIFHSTKKNAYLQVYACRDLIASEEYERAFPVPPEGIAGEFVNSDVVGKRMRPIGKTWDLSNCRMAIKLRMAGGEPEVDRNFPKPLPIWANMLVCDGDMGGFIFLNALNGKVLKADKHAFKGD